MNKETDICFRELLPPKLEKITDDDLTENQKKSFEERRKDIFKDKKNYITKINGKIKNLKERLDEYDFSGFNFSKN